MNPKPLAEIGLRFSDHKSALWWLGLLYRRPQQFSNSLPSNTVKKIYLFLALYCHFIPYFLLIILGQSLYFCIVDLKNNTNFTEKCGKFLIFNEDKILNAIESGIIFGFACVIFMSVIWEVFRKLNVGIVKGGEFLIVFGIGMGILSGIIIGAPLGTAGQTIFTIYFIFGFIFFIVGIIFGILEGIAIHFISYQMLFIIIFDLLIAIFLIFYFGIFADILPITILIATVGTISATRGYYWPLHMLLIWPVLRAKHYPKHPIAWDDLCIVPFPSLDKLLALPDFVG